MESHTLILSTTKTTIPTDIKIDFVTNLINRGLALTEYFGVEIDNQADYVSQDMQKVSTDITYIEIYFDTEKEINYEALREDEVDELILNIISHSDKLEMRTNGKDVVVYL